MQGNEPPPRQRGIEDLLAMLSAQAATASAGGEGLDEAQAELGMQPGHELPNIDALEEGLSRI